MSLINLDLKLPHLRDVISNRKPTCLVMSNFFRGNSGGYREAQEYLKARTDLLLKHDETPVYEMSNPREEPDIEIGNNPLIVHRTASLDYPVPVYDVPEEFQKFVEDFGHNLGRNYVVLIPDYDAGLIEPNEGYLRELATKIRGGFEFIGKLVI